MKKDYLSVGQDYRMLTINDLLQARDLYHLHLMNKPNVVATAIGRYLIRCDDLDPRMEVIWSRKPEATLSKKRKQQKERTLYNSEVRPYSWPCVLVFVKQWFHPTDFTGSGEYEPQQMVPRELHLPDGRTVPVCVVKIDRDSEASPQVDNWIFPGNLIGGGYPVIADVQERRHVASIGCLVSDGHKIYALTNRHVSGSPGEPLYSILGGNETLIGFASPLHLTRQPFNKVYPGWPGKDVWVNLDIGLIDIKDLNYWTAQVYGIGQLAELGDLSVDNLSLNIIGCPVRAFGCAGRDMRGEIQALFYRYKSAGGSEYVSDFLMGPRKDENKQHLPLNTRPGDSGTVWVVDDPGGRHDLKPIALQWGGEAFFESRSDSKIRYALATCLGTVSNLLNIYLVRDWNTIDVPQYWGALGHLSIASMAPNAIDNANLKTLMNANIDRISLDISDIDKNAGKGYTTMAKNKEFVPLADVPDAVWKLGPYKYRRTPKENPNHFADMDKPDKNGQTLLDICKDPTKITPSVWMDYYARVEDESMGLLPFRVQQIYKAMVEYVKNGQVEEFICAASILSHYIGDACQPMHISYLYDGNPANTEKVEVYDKKKKCNVWKDEPVAKGVHSAFDSNMVDYHVLEIIAGVSSIVDITRRPPLIKEIKDSAVKTVELMSKAFDKVNPSEVVDVFTKNRELTPKPMAQCLWNNFGQDMVEVIADGCCYLAMLWESAWKAGDGDKNITSLGAVDTVQLMKIYINKDFLKSYTLEEIANVL